MPSVTTNYSPHFWTHWAIKCGLQRWGTATNTKEVCIMSFSWGILKEVSSLLFQGWFRCTLFRWKGNFVPFQSSFWLSKPPPCTNCITSVFVRPLGLIPGLGSSPGEGKGYPLQYSGLENSMVCIVPGVAESDRTERLSLSVFVIFCLFVCFCSKVFNTREVWLLTLFYHIQEFSVHLFPSGLSLHLRLWNAIYFSRGSLKGPTPVLLPGKSHGWRSLVGCSSWGC